MYTLVRSLTLCGLLAVATAARADNPPPILLNSDETVKITILIEKIPKVVPPAPEPQPVPPTPVPDPKPVPPGPPVPPVPPPAGSLLVQAANLQYLGAIKFPHGTQGVSSFDYGGNGLAFNAEHGSLFIGGHAQQPFSVAEISIPPPTKFTDLRFVETAAILQPFVDAFEGQMKAIEPGSESGSVVLGGLLPYHGQLYLTSYVYYDGNGQQQLSHFASGLDLKVQGDVRGPYKVGTVGAGFVAGYFATIPKEWQEALGGPILNGQCCLSIISRSSYGPAVFSIDPEQIGKIIPAPATALLYYTGAHPLAPYGVGGTSTLFNATSRPSGMVFPEGTHSVLFFGRHGLGNYCYGEAVDCGDSAVNGKGDHAPPYAYYVWAYDANDLVSVRKGEKLPWEIKPYAVWQLDLPFAQANTNIGGVAYDPANNRIYISQSFGDGAYPLLHVFTVK